MQRLHGEGREYTAKLSPANYEWLREKAHAERKSQALVLNESLDWLRRAERNAKPYSEEGGGDG